MDLRKRTKVKINCKGERKKARKKKSKGMKRSKNKKK